MSGHNAGGRSAKPTLSCDEQVALLIKRGLAVSDYAACAAFLGTNSYYRFSGYARYFQRAPHFGDDTFLPGHAFDEIRAIYESDEEMRNLLRRQLARAELLLRSHVAQVIADTCGPYRRYREEDFYSYVASGERTLDACLRDIERSNERHILRYKNGHAGGTAFSDLPVWSAVEAWSFGTLSKCIERGANGGLKDAIATSLGVAKAGFAYRVRSLVYLRNRCAHHNRLWHHSVIDAGPTPNNVRVKAKKMAGQFEPRSVLDVIASLDDVLVRARAAEPVLPTLVQQHARDSAFWQGLTHPQNPRDHEM